MNMDRTSVSASGFQGIKAVGFDLGETLLFYPGVGLSWTKHYPDALQAIGDACAIEISQVHIDKGSAILSRFNTREIPREEEVTSEVIFKMILESWGLDVQVHLQNAIQAFFTYFQRNAQAYDDSAEVVRALQSRGLRTGVLTDVPYGMPTEFVAKDLDSAGISNLFSAVVTSTDAGFRKPHRAPFNKLAELLMASPAEMVFIGNEKKDIQGAMAAGMRAVLVNREGSDLDYGQNLTLPNLREFLKILR